MVFVPFVYNASSVIRYVIVGIESGCMIEPIHIDCLVQDCSNSSHWSHCSLTPSHRYRVGLRIPPHDTAKWHSPWRTRDVVLRQSNERSNRSTNHGLLYICITWFIAKKKEIFKHTDCHIGRNISVCGKLLHCAHYVIHYIRCLMALSA